MQQEAQLEDGGDTLQYQQADLEYAAPLFKSTGERSRWTGEHQRGSSSIFVQIGDANPAPERDVHPSSVGASASVSYTACTVPHIMALV